MREGWEIKKLGDLTTAINGLWVGKKPPFVNIAVIRNTNFTKDCRLNTTDIAYIDAEVKHFSTRKLQCGDIIIEKSGGSDKQPVGRPVIFNIPNGDYSFSNFTSTLRIKNKEEIIPAFLHKVLFAIYRSGKTASMQSKTTGIRNLDFKSYLKLPIPVPPVQEQEKIVAELDCLTGIIEKKKQQLKELDNLAQSIFYDMFGDPITNERGWEKRKYEDVSSVITDGEHQTPKREEKGIYLLSARNILNHGLSLQDVDYIGEEEYARISKRIVPQADDVLLSCSGSVGRVCLVPQNLRFQLVRSVALIRLLKEMNPTFFEYLITTDYTQQQINANKTQSAQSNLFQGRIKKLEAIVPPLDLQSAFAQKIEAIEKQKELIKKSIQETETLFNSRMDYWFN